MPAVGFHNEENIYTPRPPHGISRTDLPRGYLLSYLGENKQVLLCPGTTFAQGLDAFTTTWAGMDPRGLPGTYQGVTPTNWRMVRKIHRNFVLSEGIDRTFGWDKAASLPVFMDPIIDLGQGQGGWSSVSGGAWDQTGMIIHGNSGALPILMDDGRVIQFERSHYPPIWGSWVSSDPVLGIRTQVDEILGML